MVLLSAAVYGGVPATDTTSSAHRITIMTYNIKMLPRLAFTIHHHPVKRAKLIPAKLIEENPDVIVFQEGFDELATRILKRRLKAVYPYNAGYNNRIGLIYRKAGGVLMFSKYPLKQLESIKYKQCKGIDCAGHKGCLLVEVEHPAMKFQLLGTHMQAGGGESLKLSQYSEAGDLLKRHEKPGEPQFAAGDFNTSKVNKVLYPALVKALNAEDGDITGDLLFTSDHMLNDMENYRPDKRNLIDYVFYKGNGVKPISAQRYIRQFRQQWDTKHKDLSDHFAMILRMQME